MSRKLAVLADRTPNVPSRNRLDPDNRHHAAILATRGYCCDNNCRHCPYTE